MRGSGAERLRPALGDDDALVARIALGEEAAFRELAQRWGARLRDYVRHVSGDAAAADDLLQEVLVRVFRAAPQRDAVQPFAVWLYCIARHVAVSHLRQRDARGRLLQALAAGSHALLARFQRHEAPPPLRMVADQEFAAAFATALRTLPEEFRSVFLLRQREGLSYEEIAAIVGIPAKTVSTRLVRAREKLRRELAAFADDPRSSP